MVTYTMTTNPADAIKLEGKGLLQEAVHRLPSVDASTLTMIIANHDRFGFSYVRTGEDDWKFMPAALVLGENGNLVTKYLHKDSLETIIEEIMQDKYVASQRAATADRRVTGT